MSTSIPTRSQGRLPAGAGSGSTSRRSHLSVVRADEPRRASTTAPLRLTRRGRAVVRVALVLAMVAALALVALGLARTAQAADTPVRPMPVSYHVVVPGETLWGIAQGVAPRVDPRDTVARIIEFNALQSSAVVAGQRLALPPGLAGAH